MIKRRELKNRSNSREFFLTLESINEKVTSVIIDANVLNPEKLFTEYLTIVSGTSQLLLANSFSDVLN